MTLRYLSVCAGIEAASEAVRPLGWQAVAFSEIDKAASRVLAHRHPNVPNLGDFTAIVPRDFAETHGRVDVLFGGTPCQAFSVPRECERLQGFPDDHTLVPDAKGRPQADGPRYRQIGNSWPVPVAAWICGRIDALLAERVARP